MASDSDASASTLTKRLKRAASRRSASPNSRALLSRLRRSPCAPADWSALLDHADAIDFFNRPEPAPAGPSDRIFHLAITAANRHRELAVNDPFDTPGLAHLIALTRRAVRDRQVLSPETLDDVQFAALATAWLDAQAADPDDDPGRWRTG